MKTYSKEESEILSQIGAEARKRCGIRVSPPFSGEEGGGEPMRRALRILFEGDGAWDAETLRADGCACLRCGGRSFALRGDGFSCKSCGTEYEREERSVLLLYGNTGTERKRK